MERVHRYWEGRMDTDCRGAQKFGFVKISAVEMEYSLNIVCKNWVKARHWSVDILESHWDIWLY